jgi:hypothetical protein
MQYLKVKDAEELVRDADSSAILNTDNNSLKSYKLKRKRESQIDNMLVEHQELKKDIDEIKNLLKALIGHSK